MKWTDALIFKLTVSAAIFVFSSTIHAKTESCNTWIKAFAMYEDEINNKIVQKHSLYPPAEWEPNSRYDGIVLVKSLPTGQKAPTLEVEYRSSSRDIRKVETFKDLKPFEGNASLRHFDDFQPDEFFTFEQAGVYFIRLRVAGKLICEDRYPYYLGD